jgi:hypothetical protein
MTHDTGGLAGTGDMRLQHSGLRLGSLFVLPLAFLAIGAYVRAVSGPFWLGTNFDPDYAYLINGQRLTVGLPVGHIDHPGTPVQMLAAAIIRLNGSAASDASRDVLARPEHYLMQLTLVMTILVSGALLMLGVAALRFSNSLSFALLAQTGPFLSGRVLARDTFRANPEPALIALALLLVSGAFFFGSGTRSFRGAFALCSGVVVGLGLACKVTFAPMLLLPLLCLQRGRDKWILIVSTAASFVFGTLPIVNVYPYFGRWLVGLLTHKGPYGLGDAGFIGVQNALTGARALLAAAPIFLVGAALGLTVLIWRSRPRYRVARKTEESATLRILAGLVCAGVTGASLVLKHPEPRYMISSLAVTGPLIVTGVNVLARNGFQQRRWVRRVPVALVAVLIVGQCFGFAAELRTVRAWRDQAARIDSTTAASFAGCAVVYLYRCSSPEFALSFGTHYGTGVDLRRELSAMYPRYYEIWNELGDWAGSLKWSEVVERNRCVVLRGGQGFSGMHLEAGLMAEPVLSGGESLYLLTRAGP